MAWLLRGHCGVSGSGHDRKHGLGDDPDLRDSTDFTTPPRVVASGARKSGGLLSLSGLVLCLCLGWTAERASVQAQQLKILTPLYARPGSDFWTHVVDAAQNTTVSYSVVINPNSGPGEVTEDVYTQGIYDLWNADIEVLCYVPTGFGLTEVSEVIADIDMYQALYPDLCGGFFFDEGPGSEENAYKYTEYYNHVQAVDNFKTVVVNPGIRPHASLYNIGDAYAAENGGAGGQVIVVSFENKYQVFDDGSQDVRNRQVPYPPRYVEDRYMHAILVYAAFFATLTDYLDFTVLQLYCENWGYVFFTDDAFGDDGNPWDETPGYFVSLLEAVEKAEEMSSQCGTHSPTNAPTMAPTLPPLAPGETYPPLPTPAPTVFETVQPAGIGQTRAPSVLDPTPAPTARPTLAPTGAPTVHPTLSPSVRPTVLLTPAPIPGSERGDSGAWRGTTPSSLVLVFSALAAALLWSA